MMFMLALVSFRLSGSFVHACVPDLWEHEACLCIHKTDPLMPYALAKPGPSLATSRATVIAGLVYITYVVTKE